MVTIQKQTYLTSDKIYREIVALSTDTISTTNLANGSMLYDMDTATYYIYDETGGVWRDTNGSVKA